MKVLVFSHEFPPDVGGAGVVGLQNAQLLSEYGHDVTVLTSNKNRIVDTNCPFKIVELPVFYKLWFISYFIYLSFCKFDFYVLNDRVSVFTAGLFFSKSKLKRSICFLHGSEPENIYIDPSLFKKYFGYRAMYERAICGAFQVVAVSHYMKKKFISMAGSSVDPYKILVSYAGIDHEMFFEDDASFLRSKLGLSKKNYVFISVGRIEKSKGYLEKYFAFKKIAEVDESVVWIVVGDGSFSKEFQKLVQSDELNRRVVFVGRVDRKLLSKYYSGADVFWQLSNLNESFGLVYIEASACGIPVIGLNRSGVKESIVNGLTGYLVNSAEDVFGLYINGDISRIKKQDCIKFSMKFDSRLIPSWVVYFS